MQPQMNVTHDILHCVITELTKTQCKGRTTSAIVPAHQSGKGYKAFSTQSSLFRSEVN